MFGICKKVIPLLTTLIIVAFSSVSSSAIAKEKAFDTEKSRIWMNSTSVISIDGKRPKLFLYLTDLEPGEHVVVFRSFRTNSYFLTYREHTVRAFFAKGIKYLWHFDTVTGDLYFKELGSDFVIPKNCVGFPRNKQCAKSLNDAKMLSNQKVEFTN